VLIVARIHDEDMFGLIVIAFVVLVGPLALLFGVDSRTDDVERRRRFGA
jgi:hypothetical protein